MPTATAATRSGRAITAEYVRNALDHSTVFVERAILALYARQTADEQAVQTTNVNNGRGFTGVDAFILSSFAVQITENRRGNREGQRLSIRQYTLARRKLVKYARQLVEIAAERTAHGAAVAAEPGMRVVAQFTVTQADAAAYIERRDATRAAAAPSKSSGRATVKNRKPRDCETCHGKRFATVIEAGTREIIPCPVCA